MSNYLKTRFLILLTITAFVFVSCSDDDDETPEGPSGQIVGSWQSSTVDVGDLEINGESFVDFYTALGVPQMVIDQLESTFESSASQGFEVDFEFKADGTYEAEDSEGTYNGTWELTSNDTKLLFDKGTTDEFEFDIAALTDSRLELAYTESDNSEDIDLDGTNDEITFTISIVLTKS